MTQLNVASFRDVLQKNQFVNITILAEDLTLNSRQTVMTGLLLQ